MYIYTKVNYFVINQNFLILDQKTTLKFRSVIEVTKYKKEVSNSFNDVLNIEIR